MGTSTDPYKEPQHKEASGDTQAWDLRKNYCRRWSASAPSMKEPSSMKA